MKNAYYTKVHDFLKPIVTFFHPLDVKGLENVPDEPVVLCPNHSSWWDPILVIAALRRDYPLVVMAKNQLFRIPVLKTFLRKLGVFPVDRGNADIGALKRAIQGLKDGWSLMLFPEGTRVKHGKVVTPKNGAILLAQRADVPVVPVFITPDRKPFQPIKIIMGEPYKPEYSCRRPDSDELDRLTAELMDRIRALGAK